jgi:glucokinase
MSVDPGYYVGVDVGGTNLRAALVASPLEKGHLLAVQYAPTLSQEGHAAVLSRLAGLIRASISAAGLQPEQISAVGVGLPGRLNPAEGLVEFLPNLVGNWKNVQAVEMLSTALNLPHLRSSIHLINDARAMTFGEWKHGAGRGVATMACLTLGTGIGGGVVVNGQLLWGVNGTLGELGHQIVEADGLPCPCGGRGCLEAYASGTAIATFAAQAVREGRDTLLQDLAGGDPKRVTAILVARAAQQGDPLARDLFERAGVYLGMVICNIALTINPQRVVIGGGMAGGAEKAGSAGKAGGAVRPGVGDLILEQARRTLRERVHLAPVDQIEIIPARLGPEAGLVGAACWAEQQNQMVKIL